MAAMAMRTLARKVMPVPAALRRAPPPPPSRSLHRLEGTASPKTTTPTGKGRASTLEEDIRFLAELAKRHADEARYYRIMALSAVSASGAVFFTLLALRNHATVGEDGEERVDHRGKRATSGPSAGTAWRERRRWEIGAAAASGVKVERVEGEHDAVKEVDERGGEVGVGAGVAGAEEAARVGVETVTDEEGAEEAKAVGDWGATAVSPMEADAAAQGQGGVAREGEPRQ
uniref:Uncharacterized protein n=1 Tax=Oryza sativa subsp. japonica TaxID=39947 RepID=Q6ZDX6_ORYSJ|nr:hypothetical protein [Oryza sativa Japonica Group]BAC83527.1 hypothetical protein [Oryza sativa Japonica Group]